jgi:hypothetical protein
MSDRRGLSRLRIVVPILAALLIGCAASPVERLARVSVAFSTARDAGVSRWAPNLLAEAEALLAAAEEEISHQTERRFSVRSFRVARLLIDDAEQKIDAARVAAEQAAVAAQETAVARLRDASRAMAQVQQASRQIPSRPDTADDRAGIRVDLDKLKRELGLAQTRFDEGAFDEAALLANAVAARGERMAVMVVRSLSHRVVAAPDSRATR